MASLLFRSPLASLVILFAVTAVAAAETLYYNDWTLASMPGEVRAASGGVADDADGDGIPNGLEFLWGLDPMVADPAPVYAAQFSASPARLAFPFPLAATGRAGVDVGLGHSTDLQQWAPVAAEDAVADDRRILSVPVDLAGTGFFAPRLIVSGLDNPGGPVYFTLQAENESWSNAAVETEWSGYTGAGYVNTANAIGEWIEFEVSLLQPGTYRLDLVYALGGGSSRPHDISVNGQAAASFNPGPTTWDDWRVQSFNLPLLAGINSVRLTGTGSGGAANIDRLDVYAPQGPVFVTLAATAVGPGSVTIEPASQDGRYRLGTQVTLTAVADDGALFDGWAGDAVSTEPVIQLTLDQDASVQALFSKDIGDYLPDFSLVGWAGEAGGTTGGAGGSEVTVTTYDQLVAALTSDATLIVYVSGTIRGAGTSIRVSSNKSILGLGSDARLENLGLQIGWNSEYGQIGNVIIRNIHFGEVLAPTDKILVSYGGHHVWIDHCVFESPPTTDTDKYDGQLDITHGADFVTVSWCRFIQHSKNSLVGHSENNAAEDTGHLRVTYHHNEFRNTNSRNPSVRFGTVHVFNNYYNNVTDYGIAARLGAQVVVENNYFLNVLEPMNADTNLSDIPGHIRGEETNIYINCGPNSIISAPATWIPPYAYTLDDASLVPAAVDSYAGTGVVSW